MTKCLWSFDLPFILDNQLESSIANPVITPEGLEDMDRTQNERPSEIPSEHASGQVALQAPTQVEKEWDDEDPTRPPQGIRAVIHGLNRPKVRTQCLCLLQVSHRFTDTT